MNQRLITKSFKRSFLAIAIISSLHATTVLAEEAVNDEKDVERIMVTASKRLKGLQESPVAVTVIGNAALEKAKILDINDLQSLVPTLRVIPLQRSTNTSFTIRGFGNGANNTGIEPSVGVFIDGVYRSRAASQIGDLPRLDQIEVLSGPQSTLFGKNASAGVISIRTQAPSYDFESKVEVSVGNYNQQQIKGYVTNGVSDTLALSFSGGFNKRDGYTKSTVDLDDVNNRDRWNIRSQALYEPTQDVTLRVIADYNEIDETCCTIEHIINGPASNAIAALGGVVDPVSDSLQYTSALNSNPEDKIEDGGISMQLDVDFDGYSFTSISSYRKNKSNFDNDVDFTSVDIIRETGNTDIETMTQEFRLTSTDQQQLEWMFGAYIFHEEVNSADRMQFRENIRPFFDVLLSTRAPGLLGTVENLYGFAPGTFYAAGSHTDTVYKQDNDAYSLFANFDYHISDKLTAIFGVSYTKDEKTLMINQDNQYTYSKINFNTDLTVFGAPLPAFADHPTLGPLVAAIPVLKSLQFLPPMLNIPNSAEDNTTDDSKTTWSARLAYEVNNNVNVFAAASTGFKASSWNLSRNANPFLADKDNIEAAGLTQQNQSYGGRYAAPEKATVYELGVKTRFEKGALNVTIFDQTIEDFQAAVFIGTGFVLGNAGKQSTKGIEFDSVYTPIENWSLSLAGTFLDPLYDSFPGATGLNGPVDLSGKKPGGIHERSITAGITYNLELSSGAYGYIRADYQYESDVPVSDNAPEGVNRQVNTINASAGLTFDNGVSVQIWARNLNNDEYYLQAFAAPIQAGSFNAYPNPPRTFGASVSYEFY